MKAWCWLAACGVVLTSSLLLAQKPAGQSERFDLLVREDFFAGIFGDEARLDRGMKYCEEILAKNPNHAQALVWHGGGLVTRASSVYARGDTAAGDRLWQQGLYEVNRARELAPDDMGVKIGRSALLLGMASSGFDPNDPEGRKLLDSAVHDYELVYEVQKSQLARLSSHSRGELLFGLAAGWSRLGNEAETRRYLETIVRECAGSGYEKEARRDLLKKPFGVVDHSCIGCHVNKK